MTRFLLGKVVLFLDIDGTITRPRADAPGGPRPTLCNQPLFMVMVEAAPRGPGGGATPKVRPIDF